MKTIEISSYPKSGNTWFRYLINQFLIEYSAKNIELPMDIHQKRSEVINKRKRISIPNVSDQVSFYKSHIVDHKVINPDRIIYIYRHPLDVLLSTLNHLYLQHSKGKLNEKRRHEIFIGGVAKKCEDIFSDREMAHYLSIFKTNLGENFFPGMLGKKSNYFKHVISALENSKAVSIKYEDLIENTAEVAVSALSEVLGVRFDHSILDTSAVDEKTKYSQNKGFFWKSASGTRFEFFSNKQISDFEAVHKKSLKSIGY